ncbi:MAG: hypothetical protein A3B31_01435 [Candidatus Komeilibacteria bacterium RIFCSPLOWO2_01_FULL_53_11]|uniref:Uncharacterized protein n=1 Tax=Candidatus Komeilibacteria bacterium RIFCSPLOWO2_01_FULL_53_11 TaxID=1798552 RepID=A0A1G2BT67_9BACT|nr:MAG: hypothetical protein A3B31_01435 [Candidatus Komeilibacteria bacterium RIFCSPLOWO2_01_FULL_53_11]
MQLTLCSILFFVVGIGLAAMVSFALFSDETLRLASRLRRLMSGRTRMVVVSAAAAAIILLMISIPRHVEIVPCGEPVTANILNGAAQATWSTVMAEAVRITCAGE